MSGGRSRSTAARPRCSGSKRAGPGNGQPRPRNERTAMLKLLFGAAAGFAAAWFLDPNDGTRRRHVLRDKATSYARKGKQEAVRKADYAAGQAKGAASTVTPSARPPAEERLNDPALASKVESE